jgi:hypothetical protein
MAVSRVKTSSILQGFPKSRSLLAGNAGFDPAATWLIQRVTATGGEASLSFTSIPQTYKHLQIRGIARDTQAVSYLIPINMTFNSDSGTNYAWHRLEGNGSTVGASGTGSTNYVYLATSSIGDSATASIYGSTLVDIQDYASTTKYKTARALSAADKNGAGGYMTLVSGLWMNTNAITSITLTSGGTAFKSGSTFALYGMVG